jgi:hypothetical protein
MEADAALECRPPGVIEERGAMGSVTFSVSLGGIEKHGEACAVKLFN